MALASDDSPYWLHSSVEITYVLNELCKAGSGLTVEVEGADASFVTTILEVDRESRFVYLDPPNGSMQQEAIRKIGRLILRSSADGLRIEFILEGVTTATFDGGPALRAPLPGRVLKVQRRAFFRVATPISRSIHCTIPLPEQKTLTCRVIDIGLGGMALSAKETDPELQADDIYDKCRIELPDATRLDIQVHVRHASLIQIPGRPTVRRYGCEFVKLQKAQETFIQRLVLQLERERRAMVES